MKPAEELLMALGLSTMAKSTFKMSCYNLFKVRLKQFHYKGFHLHSSCLQKDIKRVEHTEEVVGVIWWDGWRLGRIRVQLLAFILI
jgi:hypothetical protein